MAQPRHRVATEAAVDDDLELAQPARAMESVVIGKATAARGADHELSAVAAAVSSRFAAEGESVALALEASGSTRAVQSSLTLCFTGMLRGLVVLLLTAAMTTAFLDWRRVEDSDVLRSRLMSGIFACGLLAVAFELFDKSSVMLLCAGVMWTILAVSDHPKETKEGMARLEHQLEDGVGEVGKILLFLLPAMGLCESIDHFNGFAVVAHGARWAMAGRKRRLMPIIALFSFVLCTVVDSMSAMLVCLKTLRRLLPKDEVWRRQCGAMAVLGSNACVWSPIGEVTTAMLWIGGKISPGKIAAWLILPSLVSVLVPLACLWRITNGQFEEPARAPVLTRSQEEDAAVHDGENEDDVDPGPKQEDDSNGLLTELPAFEKQEEVTYSSLFVFLLGIGCIITVPILKMHTDLPPYFGMLFALGLMWFTTDLLGIQADESATPESHTAGVVAALHKVDIAGLLFFAGVLQSVSALDSGNVLRGYAEQLKATFGDSPLLISSSLGLASSLVDNVPLVEAAIDMFDAVSIDEPLWQLVALAAGTGGSLLATGGIAGVTFMSVEGISFLWYFRNVSCWALVGFCSGIMTYQLQNLLFR
eukprot:TRINITY_DN43781_c0_g1_i1.p1 TRINITY_DN43781_c0_g1~~TRINITY_DN43781_c0_g1_i1.p1  ORF type:complete len:590 (-),score=107.39 TRINITY_DN43781_c0_g1_i1:167-1936(-)